MTTLTTKDCDILLEAISAWEKSDVNGRLLVSLLKTTLGGKKETEEEMSARIKKEGEEMDRAVKLREQTAILLKAKIVNIRQDIIDTNVENLVKG
jgi:predicted sulfurtransferase